MQEQDDSAIISPFATYVKSTAHFKLDQQMTIDLSCVLYIRHLDRGLKTTYTFLVGSFLQIDVQLGLGGNCKGDTKAGSG